MYGESFIATKFLSLPRITFRLRKQTFKLQEKKLQKRPPSKKKTQREVVENSHGVISVCEVNVKTIHPPSQPIRRQNPTWICAKHVGMN